jgi:hypothetical protein
MSKTKIFKLGLIVLLVGNIILLSFLFIGKNKMRNRMPEQPKKVVIKRLGFDAKQIAQYEELISEHQLKIKGNAQRIRQLKKDLYATLGETQNDNKVSDSLLNEITTAKSAIEKIHYAHFLDIKSICNEDQLAAFAELSQEMANLFAPRGRERRRPQPAR